MTAGMSQAEREAERQRVREKAADRAELVRMTLRCQYLQHDLKDPGHQMCRGESPGNSGCLCRCHDNLGAIVIKPPG